MKINYFNNNNDLITLAMNCNVQHSVYLRKNSKIIKIHFQYKHNNFVRTKNMTIIIIRAKF